MYEDGYYIKDRDVCPYEIGNVYDDLEDESKKDYRQKLSLWKKELIGDKSFIRLCGEKIREAEARLMESKLYIDTLFKSYVKDSQEWTMWLIETKTKRQAVIKKELTKWLIKRDVARGKTEEKILPIEKAKQVPINEILNQEYRVRNGKQFFSCPLHTDNHPSLCWFVKENKVKCFSCGFHGDGLDLFQKLYQCDFKTAVESLNKF